MMKKIMLLNAMLVGCIALQADMQPSKDVRPENLYGVSWAHNTMASDGFKISEKKILALHRAVGKIATRKATDEFCQKQQSFWTACVPFTEANALKITCKERQHDYERLEKRNSEGQTLLMLDIITKSRTSAERLLSLSDDAQVHIDAQDDHGKTALMYAITGNLNPALIKLLIDKGADVNIRDHDGKTALELAKKVKWNQESPYIKILKAAGAK